MSIPELTICGLTKSMWKKLLFDNTGRIGRKCYIVTSLSLTAVLITFAMIIPSVTHAIGLSSKYVMMIFIIGGVGPYLYFGIILSIKRFHDLNRSGWFVLPYLLLSSIPYIPTLPVGVLTICVLGLIAMTIWLCFFPGTKGPNKFGLPAVVARLGRNAYLCAKRPLLPKGCLLPYLR